MLLKNERNGGDGKWSEKRVEEEEEKCFKHEKCSMFILNEIHKHKYFEKSCFTCKESNVCCVEWKAKHVVIEVESITLNEK
jgi:hypothetical protein